MHFLHLLNHCARANGNVHAAVDLACSQAMAGHEVTLASIGGDFEAILLASGVRHVRVAQNLRNPRVAFRAVAEVLELQRAIRADLLHAHMMSGALIGYVVTRMTATPLVTTVHNSHEWHSRVMSIGDRVVAVSKAEAKKLASRGFGAGKLRTIWNGPLGSPRYPVHGGSAPTRRRRIASVCGLHGRKGVTDILDAFASVATDHPDWDLVIAGEGPDRDALLARAEALGIGARTTFTGKIEDPLHILREAEIFVIASRAEPFGLVAVEARSAGCAIIGTRVGGIPEILENGAAGILVQPERPEEIAWAMRMLIEDEDLRRLYQSRASADLESFGTARLLKDYDRVYLEAIKARTGRWPSPTLQSDELEAG